MVTIKLLLLLLFVLLFISFSSSNNHIVSSLSLLPIKSCQNGGIDLYGNCICCFGYYGKECEMVDTRERCTQSTFTEYDIGPVCCWSKHRTIHNATNLKETTSWSISDNSMQTQNKKIKRMIKSYGPWDDNDINYFNHILKLDHIQRNGRLKQVYSLRFNNATDKIPRLPSICDSTNKPPLAFIIMLTNYDKESFQTLLNIIYHPKHYYVIHVDARNFKKEIIDTMNNDINHLFVSRQQKQPLQDPMNIQLVNIPFKGNWGTLSLVYMEVASYTYLFDMVKQRRESRLKSNSHHHDRQNTIVQWSHIINLSGHDMPTKSLHKLESFICSNLNTNYIEHFPTKDILIRFQMTSFDQGKWLVTIDREVFESNDCGKMGSLSIFDPESGGYGSQWHMIRYELAYHAISDIRSVERLLSLKFTSIPDESYYQSIKHFYPHLKHQSWKDQVNRKTYWSKYTSDTSHRYRVEKHDIDSLVPSLLFIRKVYDQDVRNYMIEKLHLLK
ncbi:GlcNAc transferase [Cavenderia fasciculata]|uniref:protein xylosyltransferase n=1 Tax=Cavenderia fasciculata TaxID=261658 RepID=F4PSV0_CACFS|nr:GlcNAc transferase [Cavenderia fasciculata]EGG21578.1 GlcNAc transferase [Cavenderia fasciculata]|eukprot:XP_004359428.1 GlcNAc transferase [Cavenderia fasciculata]